MNKQLIPFPMSDYENQKKQPSRYAWIGLLDDDAEKPSAHAIYEARATTQRDDRQTSGDDRQVSSNLTVMYRCIMPPHAATRPQGCRLRCVSIRAINQHGGIDDDNDDDDAPTRIETSND